MSELLRSVPAVSSCRNDRTNSPRRQRSTCIMTAISKTIFAVRRTDASPGWLSHLRPLKSADCRRATETPYGPHEQAAKHHTGGAEREVVKGGVTARRIYLSRFENRCIGDQQNALH